MNQRTDENQCHNTPAKFTLLKLFSHPHPWRNFTPLTFVNCQLVRFANMHLAKSQHGQVQFGASKE